MLENTLLRPLKVLAIFKLSIPANFASCSFQFLFVQINFCKKKKAAALRTAHVNCIVIRLPRNND